MARRTLVVGDIQGCADELEDLLAAVGFVESADRLIAVGDLVNRGTKSLQVMRTLRGLDAEVVLGNHDSHLGGDRKAGWTCDNAHLAHGPAR